MLQCCWDFLSLKEPFSGPRSYSFLGQLTSSDWLIKIYESPASCGNSRQLLGTIPVSQLCRGWRRSLLGLHCSSPSLSTQSCFLPILLELKIPRALPINCLYTDLHSRVCSLENSDHNSFITFSFMSLYFLHSQDYFTYMFFYAALFPIYLFNFYFYICIF